MTPLFADKTVLDRKPLNSSEVQLADLYSLGLIAYNMFTGKNFWEGVTTQEQLHHAHSNSAKRLQANLQVANDKECYDFISRLLRISNPFKNITEVLGHPFLSSKHVIIIPTMDQYRLTKSDQETIFSLFKEVETKLKTPPAAQVLISPSGEQILTSGKNFSFLAFVFSLRKEDYRPLLESIKLQTPECIIFLYFFFLNNFFFKKKSFYS